MESHPKISLGIVTYNHENFIAECIESVLAQTYPNFEIVIADDCSEDRTFEIAEKYRNLYPHKIKTIMSSAKNLGMVANTNRLLAALDSDYVALFCGDDIMMPRKLEKQMELLLANPQASFCYTNLEWFNSDTNKRICEHYGWLQKPSDRLEQILKDNCISTNTLLIRRLCLPEGGFDGTLSYLCDYAFVVDLCLKGKPVYTREILARYRRHAHNITSYNVFSEGRFALLDRFRKRFTSPDLQNSLRYFEAVAYYHLIREYLASNKRLKAVSLLPRIFPYCFSSFKWLARCGLILRDFCCPGTRLNVIKTQTSD